MWENVIFSPESGERRGGHVGFLLDSAAGDDDRMQGRSEKERQLLTSLLVGHVASYYRWWRRLDSNGRLCVREEERDTGERRET